MLLTHHTHVQFTMMREVTFKSENSVDQTVPFTEAVRYNFQDYHFKETCFY